MQPRTPISRKSRRGGIAAFLIGLTLLLVAAVAPVAEASYEDFVIQESEASLSTTQAGAHPDFETRWTVSKNPTEHVLLNPIYDVPFEDRPWAALRDLGTELPAGLLGNPAAFPTCKAAVFANLSFSTTTFCPTDTQVGVIEPGVTLFFPVGSYKTPLINLEPPVGSPNVVARLGFVALLFPIYIDIRIDPKRDDALTASLVNVPSQFPVTGSYNHFWGVPTDEAHDTERFTWREGFSCGGPCGGPVPAEQPQTAFMTNPTSCGPTEVGTNVRSSEMPEGFDYSFAPLAEIQGCDAVPFEPTMSLAPTTSNAGASSGIDVSLQIPQQGLTSPDGLRSSDLKKAVVRLPEGVSLNASAVDGLAGCSEEQIGIDRQERQIVDVGGRGAPVQLSFAGQGPVQLPRGATVAQVESALETLPAIAGGDVSVSGRRGGPWTVDFAGSLEGQDVPAISGVHSELQRLLVKAEGGTYTLTFEGETTAELDYDAEAPAVKAALEALPAITPGGVEVGGGAGMGSSLVGNRSLRIAFSGNRAGKDLQPITATSSLTGSETYLQTSTLTEGGSPVATHTVKQGGSLGFDADAPACPESSKIATGEITTPVLKNPLKASVYVAKQSDNPFGSLFAGYLVARGQGVMLKIPAKFDLDPSTGQVVGTFEPSPQQPFSELELHFKGGNRGLLTTPTQCGTYQSTYELTPWSGTPPVEGTSSFTLDKNCGDKPFAPGFRAGSTSPLAGSFTSFTTQVTRGAGTPALTGVAVDMPEGLAAKLGGIPACPDAALASVPSGAGTAAAQLAAPACPAASQVGTVVAGAGSGAPFFVKTGKAYLAGPYKGAPLSLAILTPVLAGPFDLGNVMVRVAVEIDPVTAQVRAVSDPLPTMLHGVPLDLRDVRVLLDRQGFMLNPTDCGPKEAKGLISGAGGASAQISDRFQVGECAALGFKPKISMRLKGGTKRNDNPALTVVLRPRPGDANISSLSVRFPQAEFLDQTHIGTVCTRVQWANDACPAKSVYGSVVATTPLLDEPLQGKVYLRSSDNPLPDLVTDLRGPARLPIRLEAAGRTDTVKKALRNTFDFVPDAPITRVVLKMKGGKKGLLENSRNICAKDYAATVAFTAHNGRSYKAHPKLQARCKGKNRQR